MYYIIFYHCSGQLKLKGWNRLIIINLAQLVQYTKYNVRKYNVRLWNAQSGLDLWFTGYARMQRSVPLTRSSAQCDWAQLSLQGITLITQLIAPSLPYWHPPHFRHLAGYWPLLSCLSFNNRNIESPSHYTLTLQTDRPYLCICHHFNICKPRHSIIWLLHNLGRKIDPNGVGRKAQARNNQAAWEPPCQGSHDWSLFVASQIKDFYYRADRHRGKKYTWTTMIYFC